MKRVGASGGRNERGRTGVGKKKVEGNDWEMGAAEMLLSLAPKISSVTLNLPLPPPDSSYAIQLPPPSLSCCPDQPKIGRGAGEMFPSPCMLLRFLQSTVPLYSQIQPLPGSATN